MLSCWAESVLARCVSEVVTTSVGVFVHFEELGLEA